MTFDNSDQTPPPPPSAVPTAPLPGAPTGYPAPSASAPPALVGDKSFLATWLLSLLIGYLGADRFYLGKIGTGILKLVTLGGLGIWWLVDLILVLTGAARDARGQVLSGYQQHRKVAWIVTGALVLIGLLSNIIGGNAAKDDAAPQRPASVAPATDPAAEPDEEAAETAPVEATEEPVPVEPAAPAVPAEYSSALTKAEQYSDIMHMSKAGIYDQLTSEYGEKFSPEAAQYAVDTMTADWNANALAKAKDYQELAAMSPDAIHDQLTSEYGEKFTPAEADYAIAHLND